MKCRCLLLQSPKLAYFDKGSSVPELEGLHLRRIGYNEVLVDSISIEEPTSKIDIDFSYEISGEVFKMHHRGAHTIFYTATK